MRYIITIFVKDKILSKIIGKRQQPHITLVYFFSEFKRKEVIKHIKSNLKNIGTFKIILKGLQKSKKEYYLYLLIEKNKDKILVLHKNLTSGILKKVKNKDMPSYVPHLSLGKFSNKKEFEKFKKKISKLDLKVSSQVKKITLLGLDNKKKVKYKKHFKLK